MMNIAVNKERDNLIWKWFWIINFILQFLLFHSYCEREIINYIPENMDQVGYIDVTYNIYDIFLRGDVLQSFSYALQNGVNSGMMLIGAINLLVFGFSRFTLLIPNFLGLFLCEIVGARILSRIAGSRWLGLIYYGVLMMTKAIFASVGGMFDYRWDFLTFCIYIIWLLFYIEYIYTGRKKAFYCSAAVGGVLLFVRLNTILYLGVILFIVFSVEILTAGIERRKELFVDWCKYIGVMLVMGGWYVLLNFKRFFDYYFSALFTSSSREAWKIHMDLWDNIRFYPDLLKTALMGERQIITISIMSSIGLFFIILKKKHALKEKIRVVFFLSISWLVPYLILTIMDNKNSAASMVLIGPLLICPVLLIGNVFGERSGWKKGGHVVAIITTIIGAGVFSLSMMSEYPYRTKDDAQAYVQANKAISGYMEENDMDSAEIIFDRLLSNFFPNTIQVYSREEYGERIMVSHAIPSMKKDYLMSEFDTIELAYGLENANFLVVNKMEYPTNSSYKTDLILRENRELLKEYAKKNMFLIKTVSCEGNILEIYAKPSIGVETEWADWLGRDNTTINVRNLFADCNVLVLEGGYNFSFDEVLINAMNEDGISLKSAFILDEVNKQYRIEIDISDINEKEDKIRLSFENYFVPKEVYGSADLRELTICYPSKIYLKRDR